MRKLAHSAEETRRNSRPGAKNFLMFPENQGTVTMICAPSVPTVTA
jgi:hypothetical protein